MPTAANLPLTFPDLVCGEDLDPLAIETTSDLQNLIQDVQHVLEEDLGSNLDDPNRGVGIYRYLSGTNKDIAKLPGIIESQLSDDSRLDSVTCTIIQPATPTSPWSVQVNLGVNGQVIPVTFAWSLSTGLLTKT